MKLWQKNKDVDKTIEEFTVGRDRELDLSLATHDVIGSMAHIKMLLEIGLLKPAEHLKLHEGLKKILDRIDSGEFSIEEGVEDIHSQVELILTEKYGDLGKKIHTGRSRNDQVLLDLKLYFRDQIKELVNMSRHLFNLLIRLSNKHKKTLMPGFTHFQVAMPSSFGLWFGAYAESLADDMIYLKSAFEIINRNPLGSAAGYGSSFPIKRKSTTDMLGFDSMNYNVIYAQMGRGKAEKVIGSAIGSFADTLGKLAYDICLYMGQNFGFISFPEEYTTGSSIMPHKKNPDVFEIIRGRCNKIKSLVNEVNMLTTNLPSGYHRDMQLLKENLFEGIESIKECMYMTGFMLEKIQVNKSILDDDRYQYMFSVELVNDLVRKGKTFRDAYQEVGKMIENGNYKPKKRLQHTHEGSLGNLMNDQIVELMQAHIKFFRLKYAYVDSSIKNLIANN